MNSLSLSLLMLPKWMAESGEKKVANWLCTMYAQYIYGKKNWSWIKLISFHGLKLVNWEKMNGWEDERGERRKRRWVRSHMYSMRVWLMMISSDTRFQWLNPYNSKLIGSTKDRILLLSLLLTLLLRSLTHHLAKCHGWKFYVWYKSTKY